MLSFSAIGGSKVLSGSRTSSSNMPSLGPGSLSPLPVNTSTSIGLLDSFRYPRAHGDATALTRSGLTLIQNGRGSTSILASRRFSTSFKASVGRATSLPLAWQSRSAASSCCLSLQIGNSLSLPKAHAIMQRSVSSLTLSNCGLSSTAGGVSKPRTRSERKCGTRSRLLKPAILSSQSCSPSFGARDLVGQNTSMAADDAIHAHLHQ